MLGNKAIILISLFFLTSCDFLTKKMCGEIEEQEKNLLMDLENRYSVDIEIIPCEFRYINCYIDAQEKMSHRLELLHKEILSSDILNYHSIHFYNHNGSKLHEQYYNSYYQKFDKTQIPRK